MTLAVIFFGSLLLLDRSRHFRVGTISLLLLTAYFLAIERWINDFLSIHFGNPIWKFGAYGLIILFPVTLLFLLTRQKRKLLAAVALGHLLLLPFTRPTIWWHGVASGLEASILPQRYAENRSRIFGPQQFPVLNSLNQSEVEQIDTEWKTLFRQANDQERVRLLQNAGRNKNTALIHEAIELLERDNSELEFACVQYLRSLSGKWIGNDRSRWQAWAGSRVSRIETAQRSVSRDNPLVERGFSAVTAQNCAYTAKDLQTDFLSYYLPFFPKDVSENDLSLLEETIKQLKPGPVASQNAYRSGMLYFFLALAETSWIEDRGKIPASQISEHWFMSYRHLREASEIGMMMASEVGKIIEKADSNADGKLEEREIATILVNSKQ